MPERNPDFDSLVPGLPCSRRSFVGASLAAAFALAAQPAVGQSVVQTPAEGLVTGDIAVRGPDGAEVPAYRAQPAGAGPFPTVLVVSEIFGVHEYIRDVCRRLAREGYLAIAPDLFRRQGDPSRLASVAEILDKVVGKVPDAQVMGDLDACAAWAASHGGDPARLAITGFCWGGRITWLYAAHNPRLKAGVGWYGRLAGTASMLTPNHPLDLVDKISAPVLGLYGAKDQGIPVSDVEDMRADLAKAGKKAELVIYPEAGHAFHADYRPSYRAAEAADGWAKLLAWFKKAGVDGR